MGEEENMPTEKQKEAALTQVIGDYQKMYPRERRGKMKIIRTKTRAAGGITDAEREKISLISKKWIDIAFRTKPIEPDKIVPAIKALYKAADLNAPIVVIVPSPFVMALAGGFSSVIWRLRDGDKKATTTYIATGRAIYNATATDRAIYNATYNATDRATRIATDRATYNATHDATDRATDRAIHNDTYNAIYNATYNATRIATDIATHTATHDATLTATDIATYTATYTATRDAIYTATYTATHDATYTATHDATDRATDRAIHNDTYNATDRATDNATYNATLNATLNATDIATRNATHDATHDATDRATDRAIHNATYNAIYNATYTATRIATDIATLGTKKQNNKLVKMLLESAKRWTGAYQGGNMWAGFPAYLEAMRDVLGLELPEYKKYQSWEDCAKHGGFRFMHEKFCIVSDFPEYIKLDDRGRPHCETGRSHRWRDGFSIYSWHGVQVPREWIEDKPSLKPETALKWSNIEQRRAACEIIGWDRILAELNAKTINKDDDPMIGELVEVDLPEAGKERFLRVLCGTGRRFAIPVPREMKTALQANAWSYDMEGFDFRTLLEVRT